MIAASIKERPYMNPYLGGFGIGVILFTIFLLIGKGLGASGSLTRLLIYGMGQVVPTFTSSIPYFQKYLGSETHPLYHWLFFMFIGMLGGSLIAGLRGRRTKMEIYKGPNTTNRRRMIAAVTGGILAAIGARLAGGCTSGLALTGASVLGLAAWVFFLSVFAAGLLVAFFMRREWL